MRERWAPVEGAAALRERARDLVLEAATRALRHREGFVVALAGGNTPQSLYRMLRDAPADWSRWHIFFGDERCAPRSDPQRNNRAAADAWLDLVPIPRRQIHVIPAELGPIRGARAYSRSLRGIAEFDLVLLGLGEDGHTASLFPGHDWGSAANAPDVLAVTDAPKPPPERVSLSAARLSRSREVLFLVEGESKRAAIAQWRAGADIPARAIRPPGGIYVLVDSSLLRPP